MTKEFSGHHCPFSGCLYSSGSERFFASKRFLTQHIHKVHDEKKFTCEKCQKGFGTDWWRKYHEKSCGMEWLCSCGQKYLSKESLLTHIRRTQHDLPKNLKLVPKKTTQRLNKPLQQPVPIVLVVQPVIQQFSLLVPKKPITGNNVQPILPKQPTRIVNTVAINAPQRSVPNLEQVSSCLTISKPSNNRIAKHVAKEVRKIKPETVAGTQTSDEFTPLRNHSARNSAKCLESKGSQCSGRTTKQKVRIESTCTQTNESAVIKMKKRHSGSRSRKKSVAVLTESVQPLPNHGTKNRSNKNSSSTQTNTTRMPNKPTCDSQTLTEGHLLNWKLTQEQLIPNAAKIDNIQFEDHNFSGSKLFSNLYGNIDSAVKMPANEFAEQNLIPRYLNCNDQIESNIESQSNDNSENLILDSMFSALNTESEGPQLLHSHTQTNAFSNVDYDNMLFNMETQTSDDFFELPDLEFLDNETQTPWEDIQNIEDNFTTVEKYFSIQIQTDFDPMNLSFSDCCSTSDLINTETQTQEFMAHVTNSEAQTLRDGDNLFM